MADGYISQIKLPDNKVYLLKDSEKTDEKVKQTINSENKEFPIILKNTNNTTNETSGVKYANGITVNPSAQTITASEFIGSLKSNNIIPIMSKTYPSYTCSADNTEKGWLFFGKINITNTTTWPAPWSIRYRLYVSTTETNTQGWYDCYFSVSGSTIMQYNYNNFYSTSYRPIYNHLLMYPKNGYSSYGGYFGVRVASARTPTTLGRIYKIDILEVQGCTVTFNDSIKRYDETYITTNNIANSTIWYITEYNATATGFQEAGDTNSNDTSLTYERYNHTRVTCTTIWPRYCLAFTHPTDSSKVIPANTTENSTADTKTTITNAAFNIFEKIYYKSSAPDPVLAAGSLVAVGDVWYAYSTLDLRYSFNLTTTSLVAHKDVYLVCNLVSPTTATLRGYDKTGTVASTLDTNNQGPITQTLPASEDNLIYIKLGRSYSAYQITLTADHPIYWYKDGAIRLYTEGRGINEITRSGTTFTATRDDGSTFTFTQQDTNKYHKSGSWNGLTYTATAVNSADELKFTIPNKIQTNWELNAASGNSPALLFTRDGSLTDWKIFVTSGKLSFQSATDGSTWTERAYFKDNSGDFVATSFTGKGSALTDLNASNLSSGTVPVARLPLATTSAAGAVKIGSGISVSDGTISVTADNLGLSNALHFIGITSTTLTDGSTTSTLTVKTTGSLSKTTGFVDGDVVMDGDQLREYVWSGSAWRLLGITTSTAYTQPTSTATNTWIAQISQGTDGKITATTGSLNTSGTWSGNATTATTATYIKCTDTRSTALNPTDLNAAQGVRFDFKAKGTISLTATDSYAGVMSFRPYASGSDWSGGNAHQIAFNSEGLHWRNGSASWGNWYQILDSSNTSAANTNGTAVSVTCGTDATLATINDVAVKINVTKPTYTYSDVGAAPSSTVSCTTANVKSALNTGSDTTKFLNNKGEWAVPAYTTSLAWNAITSKPNLPTGNARVFYGTSNTAAGTAAKVVTCSIYDAYTAGDILVVKFDNANTANSPTLNVNSKGAKDIRKIYNGAVNTLNANGEITGTCMFVYNGTQWILTNADYNNTYTIPTSFSITANATDGLWDITGSGGNNQVTYAVGAYDSKQTGASFYTGTTNPDGTTRLNYNGYLYATKLYSNGTEVSVSGHTHSYLSSISWSDDANLKLKQSVNGATATDVLQFAAGSNITLTGAPGKLTIAGTSDTKNTAGSTNSTSKLYLIGATSQGANPTTNSYQYTYVTEGFLSSTKLGLNITGTEKVHLEWNDTDQALEFIFA